MHRELFDEKHRLVKFATLTPNSDQSLPTGEYESDILCQDCDNKVIGGLESYANQILYGGNVSVRMQNYQQTDGLEYTKVEGVDYKKFKLFLLSILWRASISARPFFGQVYLGPYEEKLRQMIINSDPGPAMYLPCIISSYRKQKLPTQIISEPRKFRFDGKTAYAFLISGVLYVFKIIENETTPWVLESIINENSNLIVLHAKEDVAKRLLNKLFAREIF
jgi:hypothetical protein